MTHSGRINTDIWVFSRPAFTATRCYWITGYYNEVRRWRGTELCSPHSGPVTASRRTLSPLHMSWCLGLIQIPDQSAWSGAEVKVTHRRCIQLIQLTCSLSDTHTHCSTSAVKPLSSAWLFLSLLHRLIKCFHLNILKWCYSKATAGNLIE